MFQEVGEYYYPGLSGDMLRALYFKNDEGLRKYLDSYRKVCRPKKYYTFNWYLDFRADKWYRYKYDSQAHQYCIICTEQNLGYILGEIRLNEEVFHKYFVTRESLLGF